MAAGAAAAAAAIANAIKATGILVRVDPDNFQSILKKIEKPLIVSTTGGIFTTSYRYLVSYKGFAFFTKSKAPIILPVGTEMVVANKIWLPQ